MRPLIVAVLFSIPLIAFGQNRSAELDKAYEEARAAYLALKEAERRRDQGVESLPGERLGTVGGSTAAPGGGGNGGGTVGGGTAGGSVRAGTASGSPRGGTAGSTVGGGTAGGGSAANKPGRRTRLSDEYLERQAQLEREVELARKRYEAAVKRWNDLK